MNTITDDDLVLYHYRDGLDPARIEQIASALAASSDLREQYAAVKRALAHFDQDDIAPAPGLGARLWRQLEPELNASGVIVAPTPSAMDRLRAWLAPPSLQFAFGAAAVVVVAIGVGFLVGRQSVTGPPPVASNQPTPTATDAAAARVLDAYVAANLRATEGVLLTASNSGDASLLEGNRELAESLVESNRLYALAAARSGNTRLADFLRQLEPVLLSLANQPATATIQSSDDLRRYLDTTDLLFQVRATEAGLKRSGERRSENHGDVTI